MQPKTGSSIINLMLLIIIEVMGAGIIFPMLPQLFILKNSPLLIDGASDNIRHLYYGISIGLWPAGMFFGTPFLGELSDKIGRKKVFLACLLMTALSYILSAIAVFFHSVMLFLGSRLLSGLFAGSYDIAQAAAADISTHENKARNMSWIILSLGLGLIIGPFITALTTEVNSIFSFGITTPFWVASMLALINAFTIGYFFRDTYLPEGKHRIDMMKIFSSFMFVFTDKRLVYLSVIFFFMVVGWISFFTGTPIYLTETFNLKVSQIGLFYCLIGFGNVITILIIQPYILKRYHLKKVIIWGSILCAVPLIMMIVFAYPAFTGVLVLVFAIFELLSYSCFLAYYSNAVTPSEQGKAMGGTASVGSIAFVLSSLLAAVLANLSPNLPIILSAVFYLFVSILAFRIK